MYSTRNLLAGLTLAFAGTVLIIPCASATAGRADAVTTPRNSAAIRTESVMRSQLLEHRVDNKSATGNGQPKNLAANVVRAYPPSCLSDPLATTVTGPSWSRSVDLFEADANGTNSLETVTITIWRVACSSSEFFTSATLMRIDRQSAFEGDNVVFPTFPGVRVAQVNNVNDIGFDDPDGRDFVRVAPEPNTVISDITTDSPVIFSTTYVLENFPYQGSGYFDFNLPFSIRFDNFYVDSNGQPSGQFFINVPGYDPTPSTYPAAFESLPINGYLSSNWYDPAHSGEGVITQIAEFPPTANGTVFTQIVFDWFTYDVDGLPFWISGNALIDASHPRSVTVPAIYLNDGGFAGDFGANATQNSWGTVTFEFPDCNSLTFSYASNGTPQPSYVPTGSGTLNLQRLVSVNGLTCE
ncbi:MAG: hypothetical protein WB784_09230 [Rhodanobacteraceae bacterium]